MKTFCSWLNIVAIFAALLIAPVSARSSYVSKSHPLFSTEREARKEQIGNIHKYEQFGFTNDPGIRVIYRRLILLSRALKKVAQKRSGQNRITKFLNFRAKQAKHAHELYPESAAIAGIYTVYKYVAYFNIRNTIPVIIPYLQQNDRVPGLPRTMHYISALQKTNYTCEQDQRKFKRLFGLEQEDAPRCKEVLGALEIYWATKIDPSYSDNWTEKRVAKYREKLTPEKRRLALRAWRHLIAESYDVVRMKAHEKVDAERMRQYRENRKKSREAVKQSHQRRRQKNRKQLRQRMLKRAKKEARASLESLEKKPNTLEEITHGLREFSRVRRYSDQWGKNRLPNYATIEEKLGSHEAETLNLFYLNGVLQKKQAVLRQLNEALKEHSSDIRLLMLKAGILAEKRKFEKAKSVLDRVLEIKPKHSIARKMLWNLMEITQSQRDEKESE